MLKLPVLIFSVFYLTSTHGFLYMIPVDEDDSDEVKKSEDLLPGASSPCNTTSEPCRVNENSPSARVTHPATIFPTYSCVTRNARAKEVHIISTYQGYGNQREFRQLPTVVGRIKLHVARLPSSGNLPVILVLTSYEAIKWDITVQEGVRIQEINLLSSFPVQSGVKVDQNPAPNIKQQKRYFGFGRRSHRREKLLAYTRGRYGLVTSFTGVFSVNSTDSWELTAGISGSCDDNYDYISDICDRKYDGYYPHPRDCSKFINCQKGIVHPLVCNGNTRWSQQNLACLATEDVECNPSTPAPFGQPIGQVELCLKSQRCWVEYKFQYDNVWNNCSGKQYITRTKYSEAPYLGVVLCTNQRYKLFLSAAPWEEFLNIADSSGHGTDHCELVGGSEGNAVLPINYWFSPITTGYYRSQWGEHFRKGPIGHGPINGSEWTGRLYTSWYSCGVSIPGDYQVLAVEDIPRATTTQTRVPETTTRETTIISSTTTTTTAAVPASTPESTSDTELQFTHRPRNISEVVGERHVLLQCATNMPATIIWRKDGEILPSRPSLSFPGIIVRRGGVLRITRLQKFHQGRYTCEASLPGHDEHYIRTEAWISVRLQATTPAPSCGIEFISRPVDKVKEDGDANGIDFSCQTNPSEGVTIQWLKNGRPINSIEDEVIWLLNDDLFIAELTLSHAGEYTCVATTEDGCSTRASGILRVQHLGNLSHVCGRPAVQPLSLPQRGRISGGADARQRGQPWTAHLCHMDSRAGCFCGGVLISSRYVLTAAHCLDPSHLIRFTRQGFSVNRRTLQIKLGKYNQFEKEEGEIIVRPDQEFMIHSQYDKETYDNDIALIHINTTVTPNDQILPICLESGGFLERHFHSLREGRGIVSGWGVLSSGSQPMNLQEVELPIHDHATCQGATRLNVTHNMFCAGYSSPVVEGSACNGDSGGPFIMKHDRVWYLVGLVSWGNPDRRCDRTYGYYTRMAKYYNWVVDQTGLLE